MNTKESFVHFHTTIHGNGYYKPWALGFTARIVPMMHGNDVTYQINDKGDVLCEFAITFCNPKDKHWCKATGREEVRAKELKTVRVRDLPRLLAEAHMKATGEAALDVVRYYTGQYDYVLRRFV